MGRVLRIVAALALACVMVGVGVPSDAQEPPAPSLTVTPSTDLADGDVVEVHGTGFAPSTFVGFCQAIDDGGTAGPDACGVPYRTLTTDATGSFSDTYTVRRFMTPSGSDGIDCAQASSSCVLGALAADGGVAGVPLTFAPQPPLEVTVSPSTDLVDGDRVEVSGAGFPPGTWVNLCQSTAISCQSTQYESVDATGSFSADYDVRRHILASGDQIDCAASPECLLHVSFGTSLGRYAMTHPLSFASRPPPAVTVSPSADLVDGDVVEIVGTDFAASSWLSICQSSSGDGYCLENTVVETDADGGFSASYAVQRFVGTDYPSSMRYDCAAPSGGCHISVSGAGAAFEPAITFAPQPSAPPIVGTVTDADGAPAEDIDVWAYAEGDGWVGSVRTVTDEAGRFELAEIPRDTPYRLLFGSLSDPSIAYQWWGGGTSRQESVPITVPEARIVDLSVWIDRFGHFDGVVTDASGDPVEGVVVRAYRPEDGLVPSHRAVTAADGSYAIANVRPGGFRVNFSPPSGSGLAAEWYGDFSRRWDATPVLVASGQTVAGVDAQLAP